MCDTCQQLKAAKETAWAEYLTREGDGTALYNAWWAARERYAEHRESHAT